MCVGCVWGVYGVCTGCGWGEGVGIIIFWGVPAMTPLKNNEVWGTPQKIMRFLSFLGLGPEVDCLLPGAGIGVAWPGLGEVPLAGWFLAVTCTIWLRFQLWRRGSDRVIGAQLFQGPKTSKHCQRSVPKHAHKEPCMLDKGPCMFEKGPRMGSQPGIPHWDPKFGNVVFFWTPGKDCAPITRSKPRRQS